MPSGGPRLLAAAAAAAARRQASSRSTTAAAASSSSSWTVRGGQASTSSSSLISSLTFSSSTPWPRRGTASLSQNPHASPAQSHATSTFSTFSSPGSNGQLTRGARACAWAGQFFSTSSLAASSTTDAAPLKKAAALDDSSSASAAASASTSEADAARGIGVYHVDIVTGDVRGAGTPAAASLRLIGEHGASEEYVLGNDQDEYGFERGSTKSYALRVRHPIGKLKRVKVAQVEPSACDLGTAWFLEKVCVSPPSFSSSSSTSSSSSSANDGGDESSPSKGVKIEFPCSGWLGSDESAENFLSSASVMERELAPAGSGGPAPGAAMAPASSLMGSGFRRGGAGSRVSSSSGLNAGTGIGICAAEAAASLRAPAGAPPSAFEALAASLSASSKSGSSRSGGDTKTLSSSWNLSSSSSSSSSPPRPLAAAQHAIKMIPLLDFEVGAAALPHPEKVQRDGAKAVCRLKSGHAGEDAYFSEELPQNRGAALGVSDGVYMWRTRGIDAGEFSRALMKHASEALLESAAREESREQPLAHSADPAAALAAAHAKALDSGTKGSATACVVVLDGVACSLVAANVGDSGFAVASLPPYWGGSGGKLGGSGGERHAVAEPAVLSKNASSSGSNPGSNSNTSQRFKPLFTPGSEAPRRVLKFRSPQQEHEFGCPFQLGHLPEADLPSSAMRTELPLRHGDLIVLGSDGLWDNVSDEGILSIAAESESSGEPAAAMARRLAGAAFEGSVDRKRGTPYSAAATEAFGMVYSGGKKDDITVLVARVHEVAPAVEEEEDEWEDDFEEE